jgi:threonine synthase
MLFDLSGRDDELVKGYMAQLNEGGSYQVSPAVFDRLKRHFAAGCCDDEQTKASIARLWSEKQYLIDPHTAVAFHVLDQYRKDTGDDTVTLVVSTASPFKFCSSVLDALGVADHRSGTDILDQLTEVTGVAAPAPLLRLKDRTRRFHGVVEKEHMVDQVLELLK